MGVATSEFARLVDLADLMTWSDQPDEALADGLVAVRRVTGADLAPFYLLDDRIESLRLVGEPDERRLLAGYERLPASSYARLPQLIRTLRPVVIGDLTHPAPEDFLPADVSAGITQHLRTGAVVPLVAGGRLLGVICLSFESGQPSSPEQVDFLAVVGRIVGAAIHHAQTAARLRELAALEDSARLEAELGAIADVASQARDELRARIVELRSACGVVEVRPGPEPVRQQRRFTGMTPREEQIMNLVVDGLSNTEIGRALHLSPETVKKDLGRIMDKLQVHNRVQAAVQIMREGLDR